MGSLVQAHPEAPGRKTPACLPSFFYPLHGEPRQCHPTAPLPPHSRVAPWCDRATHAHRPLAPLVLLVLFLHPAHATHAASAAMPPRAERAACRRYAIMVTPTQSVPEVLAVWGSDYKKATVCRRYTIMVAQSPPQSPHITNTITNPQSHTSSSSTTLP